jgi:hypothetical protein
VTYVPFCGWIVFVRASDYKYANAMSTSGEELLKSFDLLPEVEKREVASEIIRRTFSTGGEAAMDEDQMKSLYASFADEDRELAEEGMEEYNKSLAVEDTK